jgi:hypothetical protein
VILGGELAVLQAPIFDGLLLDPLTLFGDGLCSTVALSQPEALSARSSVSVTSSARMLVHSFQAMM